MKKETLTKTVNSMTRGELIRKAKELEIDEKFIVLVQKGAKIKNGNKVLREYPPFYKYYRDLLVSRIVKQTNGELLEK